MRVTPQDVILGYLGIVALAMLGASMLWSWSRPLRASLAARYLMSRADAAPDAPEQSDGSGRSHATEQPTEPRGTLSPDRVLRFAELLSDLSDDTLLDVFARVKTPEGEDKWADSRVGKFIGGRLEDRIAAVRDIRGTTPPPPPGRTLLVSDGGEKRVIPFEGARRA